MKQKSTGLFRRYVTALQKHLKASPCASLQPALTLGRRAVALGLETLDLARIHERALETLEAAGGKDGIQKRAEIFFTEALIPIVETHRAALQGKIQLKLLNASLGRRTAELAVIHRQLQRGIVWRKAMEDAGEIKGKHHNKCLAESLELQKRLRQLTHRVLSAQEDERKKISHELQDEIAQTLLGINVRLLSLKQKARNNTKGFKKEITSTQLLVANSAKSVRRFADELDAHEPMSNNRSITTALRRCGDELPASAVVAKVIRKTKFKPERRQTKLANAARSPRGIEPRKQGLGFPLLIPRGETTSVPPTNGSFPVIAMAASVGGLKALSVILGGLPADFPAAIAIVMHLSPEHKSILAEILNRRTRLAVKQAHTGDILCRANVFIAPPNHHLFVVKGGRLRLSTSGSEKVHHARPSAEPLFASVAGVYKENAIAVVLTGGDGDGSFGVQIIKEQGGKVIAQDRPTSQDFSMPETSIKTGDVDFILPLNEIAPKLIELVSAGKKSANGRPAANRRMNKPAFQNV